MSRASSGYLKVANVPEEKTRMALAGLLKELHAAGQSWIDWKYRSCKIFLQRRAISKGKFFRKSQITM
jgi:hypothetical protein